MFGAGQYISVFSYGKSPLAVIVFTNTIVTYASAAHGVSRPVQRRRGML